MKYLKIQSKGILDIKYLSLIGASSKQNNKKLFFGN